MLANCYPFENFRDISKIPNASDDYIKIKEGRIFRSANLPNFRSEIILDFIKKNHIEYLIDLRGLNEIEEYGKFKAMYDNYLKENYVINIPLDPQVKKYFPSDPYLNFYYAVIKDYCENIGKLFKDYIVNAFNKKVIIHCQYGKDRTGIIIALLLDLLGVNRNLVIKDYLASEMDTKREYISLVFKIIEEKYKGIENYLIYQCGVSLDIIERIKIRLLNIV